MYTGVVPGILHKINVTSRGKESGVTWGVSVRDQLGGNRQAARMDTLSREEKRESQTYFPKQEIVFHGCIHVLQKAKQFHKGINL